MNYLKTKIMRKIKHNSGDSFANLKDSFKKAETSNKEEIIVAQRIIDSVNELKKINKLKNEILEISKEFAKGLNIPLKNSVWLICDPLSTYLNFCGFKNELKSYDANEEHCQVLLLDFGFDILIPAGSDLNKKEITDWFWVSQLKQINKNNL